MELKEPRAGSASLFYWRETNHVGFIGRLETDGAPVLEEAFVRVKLGVESGTRQRQAVDCATFVADQEVFSHLLLPWRAHNFCRMPSMTTCIITHWAGGRGYSNEQ